MELFTVCWILATLRNPLPPRGVWLPPTLPMAETHFGACYHTLNCPTLRRARVWGTVWLHTATGGAWQPCAVCHPPRRVPGSDDRYECP